MLLTKVRSMSGRVAVFAAALGTLVPLGLPTTAYAQQSSVTARSAAEAWKQAGLNRARKVEQGNAAEHQERAREQAHTAQIRADAAARHRQIEQGMASHHQLVHADYEKNHEGLRRGHDDHARRDGHP